MTQWEYTSVTIQAAPQKDISGGFFSHHGSQRAASPSSMADLNRLGSEGWEVVSVVALPSPIAAGHSEAIAILKRPRGPR